MNKNTPKKLSTILGTYFVISITFLCGLTLYWAYYSASQAINKEMVKSFKQRYIMAQNIIEQESDRIDNAIHEIQLNKRLLLELSNNQASQAQTIFIKYSDKSKRYKTDILFISKANKPVWIDASSPVPNVQPILENVAAKSRKLLLKAKIIRLKNNGSDLTGIFKSKKIILESGEVLGIVVAGTILNDNLLLLNKIKHKTKSQDIILINNSKIIASTTSKKLALLNEIHTHSIQGDLHFEKGSSRFSPDSLILSHFKFEFFGAITSADIVFSIENDVLIKLKKSYLNTLVIIVTIFIVFLFLTLLVIRRLIHPSMKRMLDYTEKITLENNHDITIEPGSILELNSIGSAMEKMIGSIKNAQSKLQTSEKKYRELAESLPQVIFEVDTTGNIIYVNQNAFDLFRYTKKELSKGLNIIQMLIPEDRDRATKNMQGVLNGAKSGGIEYTALRSDNTNFPVIIHSNLVTKNTTPIGFRGLLIDISKQKQMETDLKLRALAIDHSSDTIVITDIKGNITYVNPAFEKITGYSRKEAMGKNPRILQSGSHDIFFYKKLWKSISNGKTWSGRFINKKKDGSQYTEDATISPVFSDKGEIISYVAVKRDVSEKLLLEGQLQQTQKMESIGTLAGGIAHDFNNILFPIVGYSEMLLADIPEESPFRKSVNQIYTGALRASELVKQILTFSRQKNGELKLMKMQPIIKEALKLIRSTIPTTIEIKQDLQPDCSAIKADPTQIHQIIMNLATNAYHAMETTGGEMNIKLKEVKLEKSDLFNQEIAPGAYACLSISDTGKGMEKKLIEKIFDPFFTTKETGKGTGMGLSVVHGIVKNMNGTIKVYSKPDKGTQFHVYLPLAEAIKEQQTSNTATSIQGGTEHILLVDDEKTIIEMEQNMLERIGYKVTSCSSSIEALEVFSATPYKFDLVITDMQMPNMSGDKLSSELTKIRPDIPILLCTGFSETISKEKASSLGIKGLLLKPIVMKNLSLKIREILDGNINGETP